MPGWKHSWSPAVASKVTCGHCSVPSAAAPDLALGMLEGGQSYCYHQRGSLLNR